MIEIEINTIWFLAVVALGAVVQTITGFAMGLLTMAGITLLGIADIAFAAAVVSFISMANTGVGLRKNYGQVDWTYLKRISVTFLPAMAIALTLLTYLSSHFYELLKLMLGVVVIVAGSVLMISPKPYARKSGPIGLSLIGLLGGTIGGLYSAGGGPIAYFMYRQPIDLSVIRASLLAVVGLSTLARTIMISVSGLMSWEILLVSALAVPLVILVTLWVSLYLHHIPEKFVRRVVYLVLLSVGGFLVFDSVVLLI